MKVFKILGGSFIALFLGLYFLPPARGGWMDDQKIENVWNYNVISSSINIPNPGAGLRNCITDLSVTMEFNGYVQIYSGFSNPLSGGTTIYQLHTSSGLALIESWSLLNPLCTEVPNSTMTIAICNLGQQPYYQLRSRINVNGYTRRKP